MAPVTKAAASEQRKRTGPATSAGVPQRPIGVRSIRDLERSGSSTSAAVSSVAIQPGATAFTRMPSLAQAAASDLVSWPIPPFDAARSEEHTSELQSLMRISYVVLCLKKKTTHE